VTFPSNAAGHLREQELTDQVTEVLDLVGELKNVLAHVNDPQLQPAVMAFLEAALVVVNTHNESLKPTIADDLAALMSAVRTIRVPAHDPDLGRTDTLDRLRRSKGLIIAGLADALDSAAAIGLLPQKAPLPQATASSVPRTNIDSLLHGIARRLADVESSLEALDRVRKSPTNFAQQRGLLNFYVGSMRIEIDIAKLHLNVDQNVVDFNSIARAVESMATLTGDLVATIRGWGGRIAEDIVAIASRVPEKIRRVAAGVRITVKWAARAIRRRRASVSVREEQVVEQVVEGAERDEVNQPSDAPPGFDKKRVRSMILSGHPVPSTWQPLVTVLDLGGSDLATVEPLRSLENIRKLILSRTAVASLAPLSSLRKLRTIYFRNTIISNLGPLSELTELRGIHFRNSPVFDLKPLAGLINLRRVEFSGTEVRDLSAVADLINLEGLFAARTMISNVESLRSLRNLQYLDISHTAVKDITPLSALRKLKIVNLIGTDVRDFSALEHVEVVFLPSGEQLSGGLTLED
jgi:hypothetical protein